MHISVDKRFTYMPLPNIIDKQGLRTVPIGPYDPKIISSYNLHYRWMSDGSAIRKYIQQADMLSETRIFRN